MYERQIQGHYLEALINAGCKYYEDENIAKIIKCYEPFRVLKKEAQGRFKGQFINNAQPDYFWNKSKDRTKYSI